MFRLREIKKSASCRLVVGTQILYQSSTRIVETHVSKQSSPGTPPGSSSPVQTTWSRSTHYIPLRLNTNGKRHDLSLQSFVIWSVPAFLVYVQMVDQMSARWQKKAQCRPDVCQWQKKRRRRLNV